MRYPSDPRHLQPVLALARRLDLATEPAPDALFEAGNAGFQIWCTPDDCPKGRESIVMTMGAFAKPCDFVASVTWGWEGETITHLRLETDAYELRAVKQRPPRTRNRPADVAWAKRKIRALFARANVPCPPIRVEKG